MIEIRGDFSLKKIDERELYTNSVITLVKVHYSSFDGVEFERDIVRHVGAVSVVPILADDEHALVISQFRAPFGRSMVEVAAGKRDVPDEPPETCALRELEEELGVKASALFELGEFDNSPGFTDEHSYSFLARGLSLGARDPQSIEEHGASTLLVRLSDVPKLISQRVITDAKTIIGLSRAREMLSMDLDARSDMFRCVCGDTNSKSDSDEFISWASSLKRL